MQLVFQHACSRFCLLALDWSFAWLPKVPQRELAHSVSLHSPSVFASFFAVCFGVFLWCVVEITYTGAAVTYSHRPYYVYWIADRRATARTTISLSHTACRHVNKGILRFTFGTKVKILQKIFGHEHSMTQRFFQGLEIVLPGLMQANQVLMPNP